MKINKDKKQKELERVFLAPNLKNFLCLTVTPATDVEDEFEIASEDKTKYKKVQQTIHGLEFITETEYIDKAILMKENSRIVFNLEAGTKLIWIEGEGYSLTTNNFKTLEEIEADYKMIK